MHAPRRPTTIGSLSLLAGLIGFLSTAQAQDYPNRPVRLITDSAPGGSIDVPVRIIAEGLSRVWRQQAVVINPPRRRRNRRAHRRDGNARWLYFRRHRRI